MKKIISTLLALGSVSAFAATSGDLILSGTVAPVLSLSVSPSGNTNLDIENGETGKQVATVDEECNDPDGFTVKAYSTNGSSLVHEDKSTLSTAYTLSYDGGPNQSLGAGPAGAISLKSSGDLTVKYSNVSNVKVNVSAYTNAPAGVYSDTVTFLIEAN